jgi:signal transduction histidine kinase
MTNKEDKDTISVIAHQLRSSLLGSKWALQMLLDGDLGPLNQKQKELICQAQSNNKKMVELLTELVELERNSEEHYTAHIKSFNITELAKHTLSEHSIQAQKRNITLSYIGTNDPVFITGNPGNIHSAIQELLTNGLKYTNKGSVTLSLKEDSEHVTITVQDTGIGIPPQEQDLIGEKFFRGINAEMQNEIGSGLGLFTVKKIIEKNKGTFSFESIEGKGSIFTITLTKKT